MQFVRNIGKMRLRNKIFLGIVSLFVLLCLCVALSPGGKTSTSATAQAEVVAQVTSKPQLAASPTLAATATSIPATRTPEPSATAATTETPAPTDIPEPTITVKPTSANQLTVEELAYVHEVATLATRTAGHLRDFTEQSGKAGDDPMLIFDSDWIKDTAIVLVALKADAQAFRDIDAPEKFTLAHSYLYAGADHLDRSVDLFTKGVDDRDASKLSESAKEMNAVTDSMGKATEEINRIRAEAEE